MLHISMQTPSMLSGVEQPNLAGLGVLIYHQMLLCHLVA